MTSSYLSDARELVVPNRQDILARTKQAVEFWHHNNRLLVQAWKEWELGVNEIAPPLEFIVSAPLMQALHKARRGNNEIEGLKNLWQEVLPGVYRAQLFDPARLAELRDYMSRASKAGIPMRAPCGIALNRFGAMLDQRSEGYFAAPSFQFFYQQFMLEYMRPISRLLFPEIAGFDGQTFGFSIQYEAKLDTDLQLHTDASSVTLNVNINRPGETFTGSQVDFYDVNTQKVTQLSFEPGVALLHRGHVPHAAQPITQGTRTNMVFWLFGQRGAIAPRGVKQGMAKVNPWQEIELASDNYAPF